MKKLTIIFVLLLGLNFNSFGQNIIIPQPIKIDYGHEEIKLSGTVTFEYKGTKGLDKYIKTEFKNRFGIDVKNDAANPVLKVMIDPERNLMTSHGWYTLTISSKNVIIVAGDEDGAFNAIQSLMQLMRKSTTLKEQHIIDAPRFQWRAYMLDEARHFFGEEQVMMILDAMAELKMNVFHWHLTNDSGWRVESKKYPLLTKIGGKRNDTQIGGWNSEKTAGEPHQGFYTQKEIKRILAYAKERHIKVIPEIEMPGHASAAIAAYPWLGSDGKKIEVPVKFGKLYPIFNVTNPKVVEFLENIVSEMIELFETDIIHIGGDEVRFNQWEENPEIVKYKESKGFTSFMDIQIEFTNKMSNFIAKKGVSMMGWNEILGKNLHADDKISFSETSQQVAKNVIVQFWKGDPKDMAKAAEGGYRIVNSYHLLTYLDYSFERIPMRKSYDFDPIPEGLPLEAEKNIIGSGCQMWTEWAATPEKIQLQSFPRIAAYSEVFWSQKDNKNYDYFLKRLAPFIKSWEQKGIKVTQIDDLK